MKARAVSIATAAGLAVVVFVVGALGHPGDPAMLPNRSRGALRRMRSCSLRPVPARSRLRSRRWRISSMRSPTTGRPGRPRTAYVSRPVTLDPSAYPLARTALRRSLAVQPRGNAGALVGLGSLAAAQHDFDDALRWGRRAVRTAPFDADAYGVLGDAQLELGRYRSRSHRSNGWSTPVRISPPTPGSATPSDSKATWPERYRRDAGGVRRGRGPAGRRLGRGAGREAPLRSRPDRERSGVVPPRAGRRPELD